MVKYASSKDRAKAERGGMGTELSRIVGLRLKRAREASGLTQSQLAERIDRTKESVSNIERGLSLPGLDTLQAICDLTGIPLSAAVEAVGDDGGTQDQRAQRNALFGRPSRRDKVLLVAIPQAMLDRG
jgi:transcriptional regulator with XRE-family HTH domain